MEKLKYILPWILVSLAFLWLGWRQYSMYQNRKLVLHGYFFSVGRVSEYYYLGRTYYLEYIYNVSGVSYLENQSLPYDIFPGCKNDLSVCSDKEFWVAYERGNPSNSLINLEIEIQDIENPVPPESLEGFR